MDAFGLGYILNEMAILGTGRSEVWILIQVCRFLLDGTRLVLPAGSVVFSFGVSSEVVKSWIIAGALVGAGIVLLRFL